jgi:hypothetical protein
MTIPWWGYVILAGLAWGTYVPIVFYGGLELTPATQGIGGRLASILCVGIAYFVLAVVIPVVMMATGGDAAKPDWKASGLVFSALAGVMGAVGAICVIFASKAAVDQAKLDQVPVTTYRMYIAPCIFCLAPIINTLLSSFWHPSKGGNWANFHFEMPGWKMWLGIALAAVGTFLVLMSKEEAEAGKAPGPKPPPVTAPSDPTPLPGPAPSKS